MAKLTLTTAATERPLTIDEVASHLNEDRESEYAALNRLIEVATTSLQNRYGTQFCTASFTQYFDGWSFGLLELSRHPVVSITSLKYTDTSGSLQTVADTVYELGDDAGRGIVRLKYNQQWPSGNRGHVDDINVVYSVGYGTRADVPEPIRQALLLTIADLYKYRETTTPEKVNTSMTRAVEHLMAGYSFKAIG